MPDVSELYPKPPAPGGGNALTSDPMRMLSIIPAMRQLEFMPLQKQQLELGIQRQQLENTQQLPLAIQRQKIENTTAQFEQYAKQNQFLADGLGTLANLDNPTMDDVHDFAVRAARNVGVPAPMINAWTHSLPQGGPELKAALAKFSLMARGNLSASGGEGTTGFTTGGAPVTGTAGQAAFGRQTAGAPQGIPSPEPGAPEATATEQKGAAEAGTAMVNYATNTIPTNRTNLDLMAKYVEQLEGKTGPWAETERRGNLLVNRLTGKTLTMTPEQIAAVEAYEKASAQLSQQQAAIHPTNQFLSSAMSSVPNPSLSSMGAKGVISVWHGQMDAFERKAQEWQKALNSGRVKQGDFFKWSAEFNKSFDPRVWQFMRMSKEQQQTFLRTMDDPYEFEQHLDQAAKKGWIKLPKKEKQSQLDMPGLRQADDGNHYMPDPNRPGKYLMLRDTA